MACHKVFESPRRRFECSNHGLARQHELVLVPFRCVRADWLIVVGLLVQNQAPNREQHLCEIRSLRVPLLRVASEPAVDEASVPVLQKAEADLAVWPEAGMQIESLRVEREFRRPRRIVPGEENVEEEDAEMV